MVKLAAWGVIVAITLQVVFYFVFNAIGYDAFTLALLLTISIAVVMLALVVFRKVSKRIG